MDRTAVQSVGFYRLAVAANDRNGDPVTAATPALSIADGAGVAVTYAGTPVASEGEIYAADIPAASLSALDVYTLTWSGTVDGVAASWKSYVELAGGYLFELAELRASDPALASPAKYSADALRAARVAAEQRFEEVAHLAYVPRGCRESLVGDGSERLRLSHNTIRRVVSCSLDGTALTATELSDLVPREWGAVDRPSGSVWTADAPVEIYYEHGLDFPPGPVHQAVMLLAKEYLVRAAIGSRATVEATDIGSFRLSVADRSGSTGIPEVDAVAAPTAFGRRPPLIG